MILYEVLDAPDKRQKRLKDWIGIVLHHTDVGGRTEISTSKWAEISRNITNYLALKDDKYVSAHYTIWRDGKISQLVDPDFYEAFHAGVSQAYNPYTQESISDLNKYAIGIEIVGDGNLHEYSEDQYISIINLIKYLRNKYIKIHPKLITGHEFISPGRKVDPGKKFNWDKLFKGIYS